ncbi:MAG: alpha/beta hydrolase [Gemmatimonadota bacterium]
MRGITLLFAICLAPAAPLLGQGPETGNARSTVASPQVLEGFLPATDGARLFFRVVGSGGDTIVVIHGGPASGLKEALDLEPLAARNHTLIFYDQRGAGMSELVAVPSRLGLPSHVEDLEAVRRRFKLNRLTLITISWGSAIALHYAIAHPGAVERVAMLNPFPPTGKEYVRRFAHLDSLRDQSTRARLRAIDSLWPLAADSQLAALCRESALTASRAYNLPGVTPGTPRGDPCDYPPEVLRFRRTARIAAMRGLGAEYDFADALSRVSRPILVVEGAESRLGLDPAKTWASKAQDARLLLIARSGHRTWLDRPEALFTALDEFVQGHWPSGAVEVPDQDPR